MDDFFDEMDAELAMDAMQLDDFEGSMQPPVIDEEEEKGPQ
jgi:hypothetical protein